jgi:hypothetical protein
LIKLVHFPKYCRLATRLIILGALAYPLVLRAQSGVQATGEDSRNRSLNTTPTRNITWMRDFSGKQTDQLVNDSRFQVALVSFFGRAGLPFNHKAAPDALLEYFGPPNDVSLTEGRYVTASACAPQLCQEKILLWADTDRTSPALIVAVVTLSRAEANGDQQIPHLWILSSYKGKPLPPPFVSSLDGWLTGEVYPALRGDSQLANGGIRTVTLLVRPSGYSQTLNPTAIKLPPF